MEEDACGVSQTFSFHTEEGARETGKGLVARISRRSKAVGEGSVGRRGLRAGSVRKAAKCREHFSVDGARRESLWLSVQAWRVIPP